MRMLKILVGILRHYVTVLLTSPPKKLSRAAIREQCVLYLSWTILAFILVVQTRTPALPDTPCHITQLAASSFLL